MSQEILRDSIDSIGGVDILYSRAGDDVTVLATVGSTSTEEATDDDALVRGSVRDFIVKKSLLILSTVTVSPAKGDRITDADGNIFEVLPLGSDGVARDSGDSGYVWRIHTKKVA